MPAKLNGNACQCRRGAARLTRSGRGLRLRPDHWALLGGIDGFYIALLRKPADA